MTELGCPKDLKEVQVSQVWSGDRRARVAGGETGSLKRRREIILRVVYGVCSWQISGQ